MGRVKCTDITPVSNLGIVSTKVNGGRICTPFKEALIIHTYNIIMSVHTYVCIIIISGTYVTHIKKFISKHFQGYKSLLYK